MISYNSSSLCAARRRRQIALSASRLATGRAYAGEFCLVGRHQQREQQVDRLIVDRVEGDGVSAGQKRRQHAAYPLPVFRGNGNTIADPGTAHFSRVRIASNTTCGGKLNCLAASSLMISRARFLLWQCTGYGYILVQDVAQL